MSKPSDGGAVHPTSRRVTEKYMDEGGYARTRTVTVLDGGISLRQWYAGQAIDRAMAAVELECRGDKANPRIPDFEGADGDRAARIACVMAGKMIKEGEKSCE